jgi:hypothetical protein
MLFPLRWIPIWSDLEIFGLFGYQTNIIVPDPALVPNSRLNATILAKNLFIVFVNLYFTVDHFVFNYGT